MILTRRHFFAGLASTLAAPAIVRAASLMPIKALPSAEELLKLQLAEAYRIPREAMSGELYKELSAITRKALIPRLYVQLYSSWPQPDWSPPE